MRKSIEKCYRYFFFGRVGILFQTILKFDEFKNLRLPRCHNSKHPADINKVDVDNYRCWWL